MKRLLIALAFLLCAHPAKATVCGDNAIEALSAAGNTAIQWAAQICVPGSNSTVNDCQVYASASSGAFNMNCGVFDSDGAAGVAQTLLCQGTPQPTATGWNSVPLSGCGTLTSGHTYWIGLIWLDTSFAPMYRTTTPVSVVYQAQVCCTLTNFSSPSSFNSAWSMYLDLTSSGGTKRLRGSVISWLPDFNGLLAMMFDEVRKLT